MTWDDVDEILYEGTKDEIARLKCPECGGNINFRLDTGGKGSFTVKCDKCGYYSKANGGDETPNCVKFFGNEHQIRN